MITNTNTNTNTKEISTLDTIPEILIFHSSNFFIHQAPTDIPVL